MARLTLHEVAERLGVHYMTAYRYVRLGKLRAAKEGAFWAVEEADLEAFLAVPEGTTTDWASDLETVLLRGDTAAGWTLIEQALASSLTPERVVTEVMGPALRSIGERWAVGAVDVYDEHLASATLRRLLARLSPTMNRRGHKRGRVLMAMAAGEMHDLGAEMVAELLRASHYEVLSLGANTPNPSLVRAAQRIRDLDAVIIGATIDPGSAGAAIAALREAGVALPILVGGGAFSAVDFDEVGADGLITGRASSPAELESVLTR